MTVALKPPEYRDEWTVDDLTGLSDDLRYELIDGRLVVTSPIGPHQDLSHKVVSALEVNCPPGFAAFMELSLQTDRRNQPRPDVAAVRLDHIGRSPVPIHDAVLVVEVLSRENTFRDMVDKLRLYAAAGVPHYWVIDPLRGPIGLTEMALDAESGQYETVRHVTDEFRTDRPWPATLDLPALTKRYASLLEAGAAGEGGDGTGEA